MLKNKTILVTGSTSGIGYAIAEAFARENANIIINGLIAQGDSTTIVEHVSSLTTGQVMYACANLTNVNDIENMIKEIQKQFGGIDVLINNAGIQHVSPIDTFPTEKWDQVIALNLSAAFHTTRLSLQYMRNKKWGRIINIASAHGLVGSVDKSAYVAAKHGIVGLTKVTALETAEEHITANCICPGWVLTPLVKKQINDKAIAKNITIEQATTELLSEKQPSMRFVQPEDIGEMALFLCKKSAEQITGSTWSIDGGWTCR